MTQRTVIMEPPVSYNEDVRGRRGFVTGIPIQLVRAGEPYWT